jgi:hypothetical protein
MCYLEMRKQAARGTDSMAADIMRHLHTRQHLGKAVIICDQPQNILGPVRKQWLKLSRNLQKQRSSTLNADKILKFTHSITHMQHMHFSAKTPLEQPEAEIYLLRPEDINVMPVHCWTVYLLTELTRPQAEAILLQLPSDALVVNYMPNAKWAKRLSMASKKELEERVHTQWRQVVQYMKGYKIDITSIIRDDIHDVDAMDDALDTLLGTSHKFLQIANEFQRVLELARPLRLSKELRSSYDSLALLAHRVQALTPGAFSQHFLETYNEDDTFFLYDKNKQKAWVYTETLSEAFTRHTLAGRLQLAKSLRTLAEYSPA